MKKSVLLLKVFLLVSIFLTGVNSVHANVLASQPQNPSKVLSNENSSIWIYHFGLGLSGNLRSMQIYASSTAASSILRIANLLECTTLSPGSCAVVMAGDTVGGTLTGDTMGYVPAVLNIFWPSPGYQLNPTKYYSVQLQYGSSGGTPYAPFGITASSTIANECIARANDACGAGTISFIRQGYYYLFDTGGFTINSLVDFVRVDSPSENQQISTPYGVPVTVTYNYVGGLGYYDKVQMGIVDINTLLEYRQSPQSIATGTRTVLFASTTLPADHAFTVKAWLYNSASSTGGILYSNNVNFKTGTTTGFSFASEAGFTTSTSTGFLRFLDVPYLLSSRVPFSYVYQIAQAVTDASVAVATSVPSSLWSWTLSSGSYSTTTNVDLFSMSTITYYLTPTWVTLLRGIMVAVTYVSFGLYVYKRSQLLV